MLKLTVNGLPRTMTERKLERLFGAHGRVFDLKMSRDIFSGHCRGRAEVKMEGHEAREAIAALDQKSVDGSTLRVRTVRKKSRRWVPAS